ncbi:T9SS type A sorting domain-containing protein [Flavobacterium selenitireducens]|uniref:T9SS type A sorting domain-containing protein n=1 Tax=Flavobacterium selenitireducens TaxID=2722704 RepID=UPI00168B7C5D|nr:T9SS type A sorting domain-containing protein [Flavobacterium selenitireducens]MBD3581318.1 T9SS type A sorting domain-containing protein [Flavobacterium selenitireducens]
MQKIVFFTWLALAFQCVAAQSSFEWIRTPAIDLSSNGNLVGYSVACDAVGNVCYAGYESDGIAYGSDIFGTVFIKKYDVQGNLLFSTNITGQAAIRNMVCDGQGNLLLAIGFRQSMTIDGQAFSTSNQGVEPMLVKLGADGTLLWQMIPTIGESVIEHFNAIAVDASGNVYIGYGNYDDSYLVKLSPSGTHQMTLLQHKVKMLTSISVDNLGNIYTAGSCAENTASFNGISAPTDLTYNVYVSKYDGSGIFQWVNYVEDITCPFPIVKAKSPDAIYFSSALSDAFALGNLSSEGPISGAEDFFVSELDSEGIFQWIREVPGEGQAGPGNRNALELDENGNVYFTGSTRGAIAWSGSHLTEAMGFHADALVLKYNSQGEVLLAKTVLGASENRFDAVAVNGQGEIFLSGFSYGSVSLDDIHHESEERFTFLTKLSGPGLGQPSHQTSEIGLYPNPAKDYIQVSGISSDNNATFYNALGQKIKTATLSPDVKFPVGDLSQGVYLLKAEGMPTKRFIKL